VRPPESERDGDATGQEAAALPVVVLHGGPGIPHDYLLPLSGLAAGGREVFFYDQLGSGNSDSPQEDEFYSVEQCAQAPPKSSTRNPKPETRNPEPETRNPKPSILKPKP